MTPTRVSPSRKARAPLVALGLLHVIPLAACAPDEVVLVELAQGGGGHGNVDGSAQSGGPGIDSGPGVDSSTDGSGGDGASDSAPGNDSSPGDCATSADCGSSGWVCEKTSCAAARGVCEQRPVICPSDPAPVCGCDGVTYWNDCIRRQTGATSESAEQCRRGARLCGSGADCGVSGASCARLFPPGPCPPPGPGFCWVLPLSCDPSSDSRRWLQCGPGPAPLPACDDTCTAIRSERPHVPEFPDSGFCR